MLIVGCTSFSGRRAAEEQGRRVAAGGIYKIGTPYEIGVSGIIRRRRDL